MNIAMLGTGRIADVSLAPAIAKIEDVHLWSVLSREVQRAGAFASKHGARAPRPAYDDLDALLADPDLDAVLIATPDKLHAGEAVRAAAAGKHVFAEKPMATSEADAQSMVAACDKAGVKLGVAYHNRWHDGLRRVARAVWDGDFGEIRHMRVHWSSPAPDASNWRAHEEVGRWWSLAGVGTHCLDQIRWMLGPACGEISTLSSLVNRSVWKGPHDETAILIMQLESGATAEFCASVLFPGPRRLEVYGSEGYALCENTLGVDGAGSIVTHEGELPFDVVDPYAAEIRDFAAAVRDDRAPEVDGVEGARNVALLVQAVEG